MKAYKKLEIEILQLEEDIVTASDAVSVAEDLNGFDDIFSFGTFGA